MTHRAEALPETLFTLALVAVLIALAVTVGAGWVAEGIAQVVETLEVAR